MNNKDILLGNNKLADWGVFASFYDPTDESLGDRQVELILSDKAKEQILALIQTDIESGQVSSMEVYTSNSIF